jgi:AP-2 complex subunit sigma-1
VILQNKQGRTRLSKWYIPLPDEEKIKIQNEVYRTIILRDIKESSIIEVKNNLFKKYSIVITKSYIKNMLHYFF